MIKGLSPRTAVERCKVPREPGHVPLVERRGLGPQWKKQRGIQAASRASSLGDQKKEVTIP